MEISLRTWKYEEKLLFFIENQKRTHDILGFPVFITLFIIGGNCTYYVSLIMVSTSVHMVANDVVISFRNVSWLWMCYLVLFLDAFKEDWWCYEDSSHKWKRGWPYLITLASFIMMWFPIMYLTIIRFWSSRVYNIFHKE